jgi:cyclase
MKRAVVLGILIAAGSLAVAIAALQAQQQQAPKVVEVENIRDNLYLLKGGGGNTTVFVGGSGVVVVDTKLAGWGQPILDTIKKLTNKPVTTIINTHTHGDHVSGNVEFPATVDVVAQVNTEANMKQMRSVTGIPQQGPPTNIFTEHNGRGLPKRTFTDRMTLGKGADQIDLYYFGRGHTNGDAWVLFPALRAVIAADIFAGKTLPILDANNGGSGVEIGTSLSKGADTIKNVDTVITGHSTLMNWNDLREYAQFNKDFLAYVQTAMKSGKSVDQAAGGYRLDEAKYKGYAIDAARLKTNVQVIYDELKK